MWGLRTTRMKRGFNISSSSWPCLGPATVTALFRKGSTISRNPRTTSIPVWYRVLPLRCVLKRPEPSTLTTEAKECIVYLSIHVSVCLFVCLFAYLSVYLSIYLSIYLCIYLYVFIYPDSSYGPNGATKFLKNPKN